MIFRVSDGIRGQLIDLDTGKPIPKVRWFDDETGTFEAYQVNGEGKVRQDAEGNWLLWMGRGRLKFVLDEQKTALLRAKLGVRVVAASVLARPVPKPTSRPHRKAVRVDPNDLLFREECEHYGCGRRANWSVSDEEPLPPQVISGVAYDQGRTVAQRWYCDKHYQPPRLLDHRGEVIQVIEDAGGVRPQWHS